MFDWFDDPTIELTAVERVAFSLQQYAVSSSSK